MSKVITSFKLLKMILDIKIYNFDLFNLIVNNFSLVFIFKFKFL